MKDGLLSFDTLKTVIPIDGVNGLNQSVFKEAVETKNGEIVRETKTLAIGRKDKPIGLTTIQISDDGLVLQCSAKMLGERYYEGINLETAHLIPHRLHELGIVDIDPDAFLESSLRSIDCTRNTHPKDVRRAVNALYEFASVNRKWRADDYTGGLTLRTRSKSANERFICYDKSYEMGRSKEAVNLGVDRFDGVLRFESNLRSFEQVRNYLEIPDPRHLRDALNSTANPNLTLFNKVYSNTLEDLQRMHQTEGTGTDHIFNIGLDRIIELHNGDFNAVRAYLLLKKTKGNPSRLLTKAKERVLLYKSRESQVLEEIEEVRRLLAA